MNWRGEGKPLPSYEGLSKLVPKETCGRVCHAVRDHLPTINCGVHRIYAFLIFASVFKNMNTDENLDEFERWKHVISLGKSDEAIS
jgi:hypothetical protein